MRIAKETHSQRHFESEWGFLLPDPASKATKVSVEGKKCKYFDHQGGLHWTVRELRVPAASGDPSEPEEPVDPHSAAGVAKATHETLMSSIPSNTAFISTYRQIGQRKSLEMFGVSEYGNKATDATRF